MRSLLTRFDPTAATEAAETTDAVTTVSSLDYVLLLFLVGVGLYMIYTVIKLKRTYMLFDSKILYPGNCNKDDCLDPIGFIDFMAPRMLLFAACLLLCGITCALSIWMPGFSNTVTMVLQMALPMCVLVWYVIVCRKAAKKFWGN